MNIRQFLFFISAFASLQILPSEGKRFRIVGGNQVSTLEYPFMARLERYGYHWCGGSIIHDKFVLTAAHCVFHFKNSGKLPPAVMRVRVGSDMTQAGGEVYEIEKVIPHENYFDHTLIDKFDIALVKVTEIILFTKRVGKIELAQHPPQEGDMAVVIGYGKEEVRRSERKRHLKAITIPIIDLDNCRRKINYVASDMICAGKPKGHEDSCMGDSGGPLVANHKLAGIVAWGIGCGREGFPGVYTNVALYTQWIGDKIRENS